MADQKKRIVLMISIIERGSGVTVSRLYSKYHVSCHYRCMGRGTASSELLDVLGFGSTERDILLSLGTGANVSFLMQQLRDGLDVDTKGIACAVPLTGLNNIAAAAMQNQIQMESGKGDEHMEQKGSSLILAAVNQGYTDEVMNTARAAGARGGTIIRSRWTGEEEIKQFLGVTFHEEKEIIAIIASAETRNAIMETINRKHGLKSEAGAMICSVGLEETARF